MWQRQNVGPVPVRGWGRLTRKGKQMPAVGTIMIAGMAVTLALGCGPGMTTVRDGAALNASVGPPRDGCEREGFLQLVPSRAFAAGVASSSSVEGRMVVTTTARSEATARGLAIYRFGENEPTPLSKALPLIGELELEQVHMGRIAHTQAKQARRKRWSKWLWWGAGLALGGGAVTLTGLFADSTGMKTGGLVLMGVGLPIEGIGAIGMSMNRSTAQEGAYANLRSVLLLGAEDDLDAAGRGVDRYNRAVRERCRRR